MSGVRNHVDEAKKGINGGLIFSILACLFLGGSLFLFFLNNDLLANGARNLWHVESLVMLAVLGIPFVFVFMHLVRSLSLSQP